ncbi:MAG TPA: hypothetical protein VFW62_11960 [bacterium]|nr:hypothetical protein [bacterium]
MAGFPAGRYPGRVKTILMPLDHAISPGSTLRRAREMLQPEERWKVLLLGTFHGPFLPLSRSVAIHDELKRKTLKRLASQRDEIQGGEGFQDFDFELLTYMGSLDNGIHYLSQEQKVDCLLLDAELGSHKEELSRVLSKIDCPVLIIPSRD